MKTYLVGGAVRDKLLDRTSHDNDYVVVGSTISEMESLGFHQVGKDFPVFLHPETNEEYALARKERKIGDKHTDFEFEFSSDVSLEDDLVRRDFTINAMALDENGNVIDYFNGQDDLKNKLLRAVRDETFIEDPLRLLRACRFSAQLDFNIERNTMNLLQTMVKNKMIEHLTEERVWKEIEKALQSNCITEKFIRNLQESGALKIVLPELYALIDTPEKLEYHPEGNSFEHTMLCLRVADWNQLSPMVKFAVLCHDLGKALTPQDILPAHHSHEFNGLSVIEKLCDRVKIPNDYRDFALISCRYHMNAHRFHQMKLRKQYDMIKAISLNFKNRQRLIDFIEVTRCDCYGRALTVSNEEKIERQKIEQRMLKIFDVMHGITLKDLPEKVQERLSKFSGKKFGEIYHEEMIKYLSNNIEN